MSTKTTTKRISLVVAAALAIGGFTAVSANAAQLDVTSTVVATSPTVATTIATPASVGSTVTATINLVQSAVSTTQTQVITATYVITDPNGTVVTPSATFTSVTGAVGGVTTTNVGAVYTNSLAVNSTIATKAVGAVSFPVTTAGRYVITYSTVNTTMVTDANVAITGGNAGNVYVSGSGAVVATAGIGTTTIGASVGGIAKVRFGTDAHGNSTVYNLISTGVGLIQTVADGSLAPASEVGIAATSDFTQGAKITTSGNTNFNDVIATAASNVAGTQTLTWTKIDSATGNPSVVATQTITWGAAPGVSTQYSLVKLLAGAVSTDVTSATSDTTSTVVTSASGTQRFTIEVEMNDQNNTAINGLTLGASIAGPGLIGIATGRSATTATGRSLTQLLAADNGSVSVWGDGSAGAATVTITATNSAGVTTILGTKAVTFVGSPAKATVAQSLYIAKAGTTLGETPSTTAGVATSVATAPAFTATVVDSAGIKVVAGSTVKMTSSNTAVITGGSCAELTASPGVFECSVSGATGAASGSSATITFSVLNATTGLYDIVAAPITFKVGGSIAAVSVALDKTSYAPGAAMNLTATAKDSSGNLAYDGQNPYIIAKPSSNMSLIGLPDITVLIGNQIVNGVNSTTSAGVASLFAPASTGDLTITGTAANAVATGVPFTASAKIVNSTDAAIASLLTKINALAALIAKIQKKLGVK